MTAYDIIKNALENAQISADAYDVVSSLIDGNEGEDYTIENYLAALEDGELLAFMGATQEAVEDAYEFLESLTNIRTYKLVFSRELKKYFEVAAKDIEEAKREFEKRIEDTGIIVDVETDRIVTERFGWQGDLHWTR